MLTKNSHDGILYKLPDAQRTNKKLEKENKKRFKKSLDKNVRKQYTK